MFIFFIGASIHACRATNRHILAFEEDKAIFDALIAPIMRKNVTCTSQPQHSAVVTIDDDDDDIILPVIKKTSRFSK
jgi:hypothetical protein